MRIDELVEYAKGMNAEEDVFVWINERVKTPLIQVELEHIIDYLCSDKRPKKLDRATYEQILKKTNDWNKTLINKAAHIKEIKADTKTILDFKDGYKIVKLIGKNAYDREGFLMRHCVSSYYDGDEEIYSLRDKNNNPHATLSSGSNQIKGKGNGSINPKYINYIVKFLEYKGLDVKDSEMKNLGYINISKLKKHLSNSCKKSLFKNKYWFKNNKLLDKDEKEFNSLDLLDYVPLVEESKDYMIKINFDLSKFLPLSINLLLKSKKIFCPPLEDAF